MKKLVIIPAYNEAKCIEKTVEKLKKIAPDFDYIIVNDGSTDHTYNICSGKKYNVLDMAFNLGIGGAVQTGYMYAIENNYDIAVQFDGDGQHDSSYLKEMFDFLKNSNSDLVIGSRFIDKKGYQSSSIRRFAIKYFTLIIKLFTNKRITDPTSGFRMCNKKMIELFASDYPKDYPEPETVVFALKNKLVVNEMPVEMNERMGGVSSISFYKSIYYMIKVTLAIFIELTRKKVLK